MRMKFVGGVGTVTGSCTWLKREKDNLQFLVDCGLYQGEGASERFNYEDFPFSPRDIAFVLLTHAHIDHCGLIPRLYRDGFCGKIVCTHATATLAELMLYDSARQGEVPYTAEHVRQMRFYPIDGRSDFRWGEYLRLEHDVWVQFHRTSHILGASSIALSLATDNEGPKNNKCIVFSGDLGNNTQDNPYQPLLKKCRTPNDQMDYIVLESTYGSRARDDGYCDFSSAVEKLADVIGKACYEKQGNIVMPAFTVQRTQDLICHLAAVFQRGLLVPWQKRHEAGKLDEKQIAAAFEKGWSGTSFRKRVTGNYLLDESVQRELETYFEYYVSKREASDKKVPSEMRELAGQSLTEERARTLLEHEANASCIKCRVSSDLAPTDKQRARELLESVTLPKGVRVLVDSPLANKVTQVFRDELLRPLPRDSSRRLYLNKQLGKYLDRESSEAVVKWLFLSDSDIDVNGHYIKYNAQSVKVRESGLDIILTAGGMCQGGPVLDHLARLISVENTTIVLTGFQGPGLGRELCHLAHKTPDADKIKSITIKGKAVRREDIKAEIVDLAPYFSGHADSRRLLRYTFTIQNAEQRRPCTVFLNHGDDKSRESLKKTIEERASENCATDRHIQKCLIPMRDGPWYDLLKGDWIDEEPSNDGLVPGEWRNLTERAVIAHERIASALERIAGKMEQQ